MGNENKPTSKKVEKVLDELAKPSQRNLVEDIYKAVNAVVEAAGVEGALSDSEKAEVFFYIGSKIQSRSVI